MAENEEAINEDVTVVDTTVDTNISGKTEEVVEQKEYNSGKKNKNKNKNKEEQKIEKAADPIVEETPVVEEPVVETKKEETPVVTEKVADPVVVQETPAVKSKADLTKRFNVRYAYIVDVRASAIKNTWSTKEIIETAVKEPTCFIAVSTKEDLDVLVANIKEIKVTVTGNDGKAFEYPEAAKEQLIARVTKHSNWLIARQ